jgi:uncharacterized membrane protein YiaA
MKDVNVSALKDWSIIIAGAIAFLTLWQGLFQYSRQGHATRASQFIQMRRRFLEDETFKNLLNLIAENSEGLRTTSIQDRRNLVGFLEEVALMVNSGLLKAEVAHYMFGYYVLAIDDCEPFWDGLDRNSEYWTVFRNFVTQMQGSPKALGNIRV